MLKIGGLELKQPALLAPMAALTDRAFRTLIDEIGGCGLLVSEMVAAEGLRRRNRRTMQMMGYFPGRAPQFIQLYGGKPAALEEAARIVACETGFAGIDFNMGCPVPKVTRRGEGAGLLKDLPAAAAAIRALRRATPLPLSVKIRLGFSQVNVCDTLAVAGAEGADAVIVHFRLARDGFTQPARWEWAEEVRAASGLPLIGNGDVATPEDAARCLRRFDGVAVGRGAVADPFLFARLAGDRIGAERQAAMAGRLCSLVEEHCPERLRLFRLKAFLRYLHFEGRMTRAAKKPIFLSQEYGEAKRLFLSTVSSLFPA